MKAPEEVKYIPFGRFATAHTTTILLDVNDFPPTIDKPQMFDAPHSQSVLSQFALDNRIRQFLHPMRVENNVRRLMKRPAQVTIDGSHVVGHGSLHFPSKPVDDHVGGCSSAFLAAANELHSQSRRS